MATDGDELVSESESMGFSDIVKGEEAASMLTASMSMDFRASAPIFSAFKPASLDLFTCDTSLITFDHFDTKANTLTLFHM